MLLGDNLLGTERILENHLIFENELFKKVSIHGFSSTLPYKFRWIHYILTIIPFFKEVTIPMHDCLPYFNFFTHKNYYNDTVIKFRHVFEVCLIFLQYLEINYLISVVKLKKCMGMIFNQK